MCYTNCWLSANTTDSSVKLISNKQTSLSGSENMCAYVNIIFARRKCWSTDGMLYYVTGWCLQQDLTFLMFTLNKTIWEDNKSKMSFNGNLQNDTLTRSLWQASNKSTSHVICCRAKFNISLQFQNIYIQFKYITGTGLIGSMAALRTTFSEILHPPLWF